MTRPRVTASHEVVSDPIRSMNGKVVYRPSVTVEVSFDLHDHESALADLDYAVARVREQITETTDAAGVSR